MGKQVSGDKYQVSSLRGRETDNGEPGLGTGRGGEDRQTSAGQEVSALEAPLYIQLPAIVTEPIKFYGFSGGNHRLCTLKAGYDPPCGIYLTTSGR